MGFEEAYFDKNMLDLEENIQPYIAPIIQSKHNTIGAFNYLKGIDWKVIDGFKDTHRSIKADTLLIWGKDDNTFPLNQAKKMMSQFGGNCRLEVIEHACLLPHEEKSREVINLILTFMNNQHTT